MNSPRPIPIRRRCEIEAAARKAGVAVAWRPFLLGPILKAQGLDNSPFALFPLKGAYMWRDVERLCEAQGLPSAAPSLSAIGLAGGAGRPDREVAPVRSAFSRRVYHAQFAEGRRSPRRRPSPASLTALKLDADAVLHDARTRRSRSDCAPRRRKPCGSIFSGRRAFVTGGGELFWGNDRLDAALGWAVQENQPDARKPLAPHPRIEINF